VEVGLVEVEMSGLEAEVVGSLRDLADWDTVVLALTEEVVA
jgi:hypothetical protein